jgi:DHA2 family multidrug resistance protein
MSRYQERSLFLGGFPAAAQLCCEAPVSDPATAHQQAIIALGNLVKQQAMAMDFSDAFAVVGVALVIAGISIALTGKPKGGAAAGGGH